MRRGFVCWSRKHTQILTKVQGDEEYTETAKFGAACKDNHVSKGDCVVEDDGGWRGGCAVPLHALLMCSGYTIILKMVLKCRSALGRMLRGGTYWLSIRQKVQGEAFEVGTTTPKWQLCAHHFGLTSVQYTWKVNVSLVATSVVKHQRQNQGTYWTQPAGIILHSKVLYAGYKIYALGIVRSKESFQSSV